MGALQRIQDNPDAEATPQRTQLRAPSVQGLHWQLRLRVLGWTPGGPQRAAGTAHERKSASRAKSSLLPSE
eukprot:623919-Pyramimonas_sp.AAC.1